MTVFPLPTYPNSRIRSGLSAGQLITLQTQIIAGLNATVALPPSKRNTTGSHSFLASYAKDEALNVLQALIWPSDRKAVKNEHIIRSRVLQLAEKLAPSGDIALATLVDLAIIYADTNLGKIRSVFKAVLEAAPGLPESVNTELIPAFTMLVSPEHSSGLYGLRKAAHCIVSFLRAAGPQLSSGFARDQSFSIALAAAYDRTLTTVAQSYGGLAVLQRAEGRELDDWERIWIQTKVAILDAFHLLVVKLFSDISSAENDRALVIASEQTFDLIFPLLELPSGSSLDSELAPTPFLNRSLLEDYQHAHDFLNVLGAALKRQQERDARLDILEATLGSFDDAPSSGPKEKNPGVLKFLLLSSGAAPGINNPGKPRGAPAATKNKGKGKETAFTSTAEDPDMDAKVAQVLDILPDNEPAYIRELLGHPDFPFRGNPEKVIEALLEGTAPAPGSLHSMDAATSAPQGVDEFENYVTQRRNVFDDNMDLSQIRKGKQETSGILRDRTFIEQMKADILRRAEEMSDEEDEEAEAEAKGKPTELLDEDEITENARVRVIGDGEDSGDEDNVDEDGEAKPTALEIQSPETTLELAYIRDPKLFDRDANTRRGKARADLKAQTGWQDEQIEGWRIMLERNPQKDKILGKHEFSGNQNQLPPDQGPQRGGSSRGRGTRGGGGGRGGRGGRGAGGGAGNSARERANKDRNKASKANHNWKSGHDKKMARAGPPPM